MNENKKQFSEDIIWLGLIIRKCRTAHKMSQEELSEQAGLNRTFISDVERGTVNPSFKTIYAIVKALGYDPHSIVTALAYTLMDSNI